MLHRLFVAALSSTALAAADVPSPTEFESLAIGSSTEVVEEQTVGSIESADATLTVVALTLEDRSRPGVSASGLRFDLADNSAMDSVYLGQEQVQSLVEDLIQIEDAVPRLESEGAAPYRVQGTESCWMPDPAIRILCPGYRVGPGWAGLILGAFGGHSFAFPEQRPLALACQLIEELPELAGLSSSNERRCQ